MALGSKNEAILCKVFFTTLVGSTLIWFHQLLKKPIGSVADFCKLVMKMDVIGGNSRRCMICIRWNREMMKPPGVSEQVPRCHELDS